MRARQPDRSSAVVRDGIASAYDVYGDEHDTTVLLLPSWSIVHAMHWKFQIPVLARRHRVIAMDGRGNGRSDRPNEPAAYSVEEYVADALAVLDETDTERAVVVGLSLGGQRAAAFASAHPERTLGAVMIGPSIPHIVSPFPIRMEYSFIDELDVDEGWALFNEHAWRRDLRKFAEFFWAQCLPEPHSTKPREDAVGWMLESDAETLVATAYAPGYTSRDEVVAMLKGIQCPTLVVLGDRSAAGFPASIADETVIDEVRRAMPRAGIVQVRGAGHMVHLDRPEDFVAAVESFLG